MEILIIKFFTGSLYKNFRAYWCYHGYVIADFGAIAAVLKITTQNWKKKTRNAAPSNPVSRLLLVPLDM